MINLKHFILLLLILFVTPDASCQYTNFQLETAYTFGKIIKHTTKLYHNPSNFSSNFELSLTKKRNGNSIWENKYGQPTTGFTFTYINSNDKIIGYIYSFMPTIAFDILKHKKIFIESRIGSGAAFATKHWQKNPLSDTINNYLGSHFNLYASVSFLVKYQYSKDLQFKSGITLSHTSNAGIIKPNYGINLLGGYVGINYQIKNIAPLKIDSNQGAIIYHQKIGADIRVGGSMAEAGFGDGPLMPIYTFALLGNYTLNRKHKLLFGIDYEYSGKTELFIRNTRQISNSLIKDAGYLSAVFGNEFLFGNFTIPIQIGVYLNAPYLKSTTHYKKMGLFYYPRLHKNIYGKGIYCGTMLKVNSFNADYLELCIGKSF